MGVGGSKFQFTLAQSKLQAGAESDVVPFVVNLYLCGTVLTGHQHGADLHVVPDVRVLHGIAQANLDHRRLNVGPVSSRPVQNGGGGMVAQVLAYPR